MVNNQWQGELRLQMPRVITLNYPGDPRVITRTVKCGKGRWGREFESVAGWETQQSPLALHLKEWGPKTRTSGSHHHWRRQDCSLYTLLKKGKLAPCLWFWSVRWESVDCDLLPQRVGRQFTLRQEDCQKPSETHLKKPKLSGLIGR